jgi:hypothetical protein
MHWLPKLHKQPYKFNLISVSNKCSTTHMCVFQAKTLTTIKQLLVNFCNKVYGHSGVNSFWGVNNSVKYKIKFVPWIVILIPLTVMISLLCIPLYHTTHNLVKEKCSYFVGYLAVITYAVTNINHYK